MPRQYESLFVAALFALTLSGCDKSSSQPEEQAPRAASTAESAGQPQTTATTETSESNGPSDGAEPVPIDSATGWPEVIAPPKTERMATKTAPAPEESDVTLDILDGDPSISPLGQNGTIEDLRVQLRAKHKKAKSADKADHAALYEDEHDTQAVRDMINDTLVKEGDQLVFETGKVMERRGELVKLSRDFEKARGLEEKADDGAGGRRHAARPKKRRLRKPAPSLDGRGTTSTFAVDVDTGSYSLSLGRMRRGYPPRPETVRVEEWLNAFHYDNDVPEGQDFSIDLEVAPNPVRGGEHLLRVNIAGKSVAERERPPAHLTFVVDVSGSMFGPDKLDLIKESLTFLAGQLRPDDTVAIVTFSKETGVVLWPTPATETDRILAAVASLEPGGSTDMEDGLKLGYAVAFRESHYKPGDIHRVVVLGDGRANVGKRRAEGILGPVSRAVEKGVTLSTIGFGAKEINDALLEELARKGNGNYAFIDTFKDARRVFGEQLCGTLHVIAKDAKIQVEFNPKVVRGWELVGYQNRRLDNEDFRDDSVDGGEIGAGHQVTALYRLNLKSEADGRIAKLRLRYLPPEGGDAKELEAEIAEASPIGSHDLHFASAVAAAAQVFSPKYLYDIDFTFPSVSRAAENGIGANPRNKPARVEFLEVIRELEPIMK
jgi:Ca-activated chloride channel family protein